MKNGSIKGELRQTKFICLIFLARAPVGEERKEQEGRKEEEEEGEGEEEDQKGMFSTWNQVYFGIPRFSFGE